MSRRREHESMTMRNLLFILVAAVATSGGCDSGGEVIPLAKVEPPSDTQNPTGKNAPPKKAPTSPSQLIYK
jgi:hypothetical protein